MMQQLYTKCTTARRALKNKVLKGDPVANTTRIPACVPRQAPRTTSCAPYNILLTVFFSVVNNARSTACGPVSFWLLQAPTLTPIVCTLFCCPAFSLFVFRAPCLSTSLAVSHIRSSSFYCAGSLVGGCLLFFTRSSSPKLLCLACRFPL